MAADSCKHKTFHLAAAGGAQIVGKMLLSQKFCGRTGHRERKVLPDQSEGQAEVTAPG